MAYQCEEQLRERAERFVEALHQAGLQAAIVPGSFRDYSVKVSVSRSGRAFGNVNLYYSPKKDLFSYKTHELRDQAVVPDLEECWQRSFQSAGPAAAPVRQEASWHAYVDGSYLDGRIGYGVVLLQVGMLEAELSGPVEESSLQGMHQVGGELRAVYETVKWCLAKGVQDVTVYYDYEGIEKWATGAWKANNPATQAYAAAMSNPPITICWQKVQSHSGDRWNERADALAKQGARSSRTEAETEQAEHPLQELARAEGFVPFLKEHSVDAVYQGIRNNQFARVAVIPAGYLDVYNTRKRSPAEPYLHGFPDSGLKSTVKGLWQEYFEGRPPESDAKKTGLEEVAYYYEVFKPYRDCAFDFAVLAAALERAWRQAKGTGFDVEAGRHDFERLEAAYLELKGDDKAS